MPDPNRPADLGTLLNKPQCVIAEAVPPAQYDEAMARTVFAKMLAATRAGHKGDIVGRSFDYEK